MTLVAAVGAAATFMVAVAIYCLGGWPSGQQTIGALLSWAPPLAWLTAIGLLIAVAVRSAAASTGVVGGIWVGQLLFNHQMQTNGLLCAQYLFATVASQVHGSDLAVNRVALLMVGVAALASTAAALSRPERLLVGDPS